MPHRWVFLLLSNEHQESRHVSSQPAGRRSLDFKNLTIWY